VKDFYYLLGAIFEVDHLATFLKMSLAEL